MNSRKLVFRLLRLSLVPLVLRHTAQRGRVTIVVYHDPDPETFEVPLTVLRRLYNIVPLRAVVEGGRLPPRALVVTLDDGHRGNSRLAPVVERLQVPVTIFLCTGIV